MIATHPELSVSALLERTANLQTLAALAGIDRRRLQRRATTGLSVVEADRLAAAVGCHPSEVWVGWYEIAERERREARNAYARKWRKTRKGRKSSKAAEAKWRASCRDYVRHAQVEWKASNPDLVRANRAAYYARNRDRLLAAKRARYRDDPEYRMRIVERERARYQAKSAA